MTNDVSVLFSGGPDSTLAALYAIERAERVHLLTFHHRLMQRTQRHRRVVDELRETFGADRIVALEEDIDALHRRCYFTKMGKRIVRYRTLYIPWLCGACKMAMHFRAIVYNCENGIRTTYDGANEEAEAYFPAQTKGYIDVIKDLYQSYGMQYDCPVYDIARTDEKAEERGLLSLRDTKKEHVFFSTQHTCLVGLLIHAHARLYYRPFRGKNRMERLASELLAQMIEDCSSLLPGTTP